MRRAKWGWLHFRASRGRVLWGVRNRERRLLYARDFTRTSGLGRGPQGQVLRGLRNCVPRRPPQGHVQCGVRNCGGVMCALDASAASHDPIGGAQGHVLRDARNCSSSDRARMRTIIDPILRLGVPRVRRHGAHVGGGVQGHVLRGARNCSSSDRARMRAIIDRF